MAVVALVETPAEAGHGEHGVIAGRAGRTGATEPGRDEFVDAGQRTGLLRGCFTLEPCRAALRCSVMNAASSIGNSVPRRELMYCSTSSAAPNSAGKTARISPTSGFEICCPSRSRFTAKARWSVNIR